MTPLLVPELLTGPRPVPPPVAVQPDQAPMRSYTMELGESPRTNRGPVAASTTVPHAREIALLTAAENVEIGLNIMNHVEPWRLPGRAPLPAWYAIHN